jgi:hypothetical protein
MVSGMASAQRVRRSGMGYRSKKIAAIVPQNSRTAK